MISSSARRPGCTGARVRCHSTICIDAPPTCRATQANADSISGNSRRNSTATVTTNTAGAISSSGS